MKNDLLKSEEVNYYESPLQSEYITELISNILNVPSLDPTNFLQSYKISRLMKRLKKCEERIENINGKVKAIDDWKFAELLQEFLFPVVLTSILEDDEDSKTGLFLQGFEKVIDDTTVNESVFIILYDTMRSLRFIEVEYLISLSPVYIKYNANNRILKTPFDSPNFINIQCAVEAKLEKLGLIILPNNFTQSDMKSLIGSLANNNRSYSGLDYREIKLTPYGKSFLEAFNLLDKYKG